MKATLRRIALPIAIYFAAAALGSGCDFSTKEWAEETLRDAPGRSISAIDPYVDFSLQYNEGTAFSVVRDLEGARVVLGALSLAMVPVLLALALRTPADRVRALALGMLAAGAIGNGVDRIVRAGVVDFIQVNYPWGGSWPTFNVADVLVAVGAALLVMRWRERDAAEA